MDQAGSQPGYPAITAAWLTRTPLTAPGTLLTTPATIAEQIRPEEGQEADIAGAVHQHVKPGGQYQVSTAQQALA